MLVSLQKGFESDSEEVLNLIIKNSFPLKRELVYFIKKIYIHRCCPFIICFFRFSTIFLTFSCKSKLNPRVEMKRT